MLERQVCMGMIDPPTNWVSASISETDKLLLGEITRQDGQETGTVGNQSATIRRLIRQEAKRRKIDGAKLAALASEQTAVVDGASEG